MPSPHFVSAFDFITYYPTINYNSSSTTSTCAEICDLLMDGNTATYTAFDEIVHTERQRQKRIHKMKAEHFQREKHLGKKSKPPIYCSLKQNARSGRKADLSEQRRNKRVSLSRSKRAR
jgi:hypothetical protein